MTYTITNQCIRCDRCLTLCPTGAIQKVENQYWIDPWLCNNCVGFYRVAQCASVCPTNRGCIPDTTTGLNQPVLVDKAGYWEQWFETYNQMLLRLRQTQRSDYWESWFDTYSQKVSKLLTPSNSSLAKVQS